MTTKVKYPRTFHTPWSQTVTSDDKRLSDLDHFIGEYVIVTAKMDGENTTLYKDAIHARSLDSRNHPSRNWVKQFNSEIAHLIPDGMRICGENLYARHSIEYTDLPSYFMAFSVWQGDLCLEWEETQYYLESLGIESVPVLWEGTFNEEEIRNLFEQQDHSKNEGIVIRLSRAFFYDEFNKSVAKAVRNSHVQTDSEHWMHSEIKPNKLCEK